MNVGNISGASGAYAGGFQINAVSGASGYVPPAASPSDALLQQLRSDIKQNTQDFKAIDTALSSNDLTGATQAYNTAVQDIQNASQAAGGKSPFDPNSPIGKDFAAIGAALKSGDVSAAKTAFATFRQDMKSAGRAGHGHHHRAASSDAPGAPAPTTTPQTPPIGGGLGFSVTA